MKNILVTGVRAPSALDLIRKLSNAGFNVYAADSVNCPLTRVSCEITKYFLISPPATNLSAFVENLEEIITRYKIDLLIPTCEEAFFISCHKQRLEKHCKVFCDDFEKMQLLHNKYTFLQAAEGCGALIPQTELVEAREEIDKITKPEEKVFKPVFSRFASHTLIRPEKAQLQSISLTREFPWVAQAYIEGTEYCTYAIAVNGKLQAYSCYQPTYRAGIGAGIYFTPSFLPDIATFVDNFVKKHNYTGQLGFDFIVTKQNQLYVIECNPRATSGIHCLPDNGDWQQILAGEKQSVLTADPKNKMVSLAMVTFGLKYLKKISWLKLFRDFYNAQDPVWSYKDMLPGFYQLVSLIEIIIKSIKTRASLKEASTADIEWNGEKL